MEQALKNITVLDFTRVYSGPYCTMLLADLGADVIKIEAVGTGDDTRAFYPIREGESGYYHYLNRGKQSVALNLKSAQGHEAALRLAERADIVIENFSPGTMERLGLDYAAVRAVNPQVIYGSISGFGHAGVRCELPAYDSIIQFSSGLASQTGYPDRKPTKTGPAIADAIAGLHMGIALLAALHYRQCTGKGQYIDISMLDTLFSTMENCVPIKSLMGIEPVREANKNKATAPVDVYEAADGDVAIQVANDGMFRRMTQVMEQPELAEDPRFRTNADRKANERELDGIVEAWTRRHTVEELESSLSAMRIPVARIKSIGEAMEDPRLIARGMLLEQEIPRVGKVKMPGCPLRMEGTPAAPGTRAPDLGEHTARVLEKLGYTREEIEDMAERGAVGLREADA